MGTPAVLGAGLFTLCVVVFRDWRVVIASFMGLHLSLALLAARSLPPEWALLRVIVGGLVAIMWYLSAQRAGWGGRFLPFHATPGVHARPLASTTLFRLLIALALAALILLARPILPFPPLPPDIRLILTWIAAFSLLGLALGEESLQSGVALLIWLAGTQLLVGILSPDVWLIWLLSVVELLAGLAIAYLMVARGPVESPQPGEDAA